MKIDTLYQVYKTVKASTELAYLLGFLAGKKRKKK